MADQEVSTSIDGLVAYLNEHGETNTTMVAAALGVGESTIIEWSNILEKANMIKIVHKSGRMFLSPLKAAPGGSSGGGGSSGTGPTAAETKIADDSDQMYIKAEIASQMAVVNQISTKIDQFSKTVSAIDDLFKTKYKNVKPVLDKLNAIQNRIDEFEKKTAAKSKQIQELSARMEKEFDSLQRYSSNLTSFSMDTNNARNVSDDINSKLRAYDTNSKAMAKELDAVMSKYRRNAMELDKELKERNDQLRQIAQLEDRQIHDYEKTAKDYKRDSESIIRRTEQRRKAALDEITKTRLEVSRLGTVGDKDLVGLKSSVEDLKKQLGNISGINDGILTVKKDLDEVTAKKNALLKELGAMSQDERAVTQIKKPAEREAKTSALKGRTEQAAGKLVDLKESTEKVNKDFDALGSDDSGNVK